jgi:uroporphyrinogen decarboxylase
MEELMVDMATESDEADVLLNRLADFSLKVALEAVRMGADWIWFGDDMGSQKSMLMSPDLWRKYYKNRMKRIIREVKSKKEDIIIAYHSCGSVFPIIGDLVEIGVQVLNPIQESAANMNQLQIKELYGDRLTLMCGLDTQTFLLNSSPDEVYNAMKNKALALSKEGGYIAAVSHTIQPDIPVKNIVSMTKALDDLYII